MDMMLPHMNGTAATRQVRWEHPHVPIIGISAVQHRDLIEAFMAAGGTAFLDKRQIASDLPPLLESHLK